MKLQISIKETFIDGETEFTASVRATNCGVPDFRSSFTGDSKHTAIVGLIKALGKHQKSVDRVIDEISKWESK